MSNAPFISIIIPTYNRANLIGKAVESVLAQSFIDWELLIVDDGSTDATKEVLAKYSDSRIRYIYQANAERCAARNNGILQSKGKYITFLDSDDYYLPQRLKLLHDELARNNFPDGLFFTGMQLYHVNTGKTEEKEVSTVSVNKYDTIALGMIHSQQVVATRKVFEGNLYNTSLTVGEDMELWLRIAAQHTIKAMPQQCTIVVVEHDDRSISIKKSNPSVKQMQTYAVMFSEGHAGNNISNAIKQNLYANTYFAFAKYHIYRAEKTSAIYWLLKSISAKLDHPQNKYKLNLIRYILTKPAQAAKLLES